jgi:hypothetical protein
LKKRIWLIPAFLVLVLIGVGIYSRMDKTDQNGWTHVKTTSTSPDDSAWDNTETSLGAADTEYLIVDVSKEDYTGITAHTFIQNISGTLTANYGKRTYVTFRFEDGTGLYCPGSSLDYVLTYGTINEIGVSVEDLAYITVSGNTVYCEEVPYDQTAESASFYGSIPEEYENDKTWAYVKDGVAYMQVWVGDKDVREVAEELLDIILSKGSYDEAHIVVNDRAFLYLSDSGLEEVDLVVGFIDDEE